MTVDSGEILMLVSLNAVIDSVLGLVIGLWLVAKAAGRRALRGWTVWLESKDADPYLDRMAQRVIAKIPAYPVIPEIPKVDDFLEAIEPRLQGFEERLNQPIQLDLDPVIDKVTGNVIAEVDKIRAVIDGKIGFFKKVGAGVGEAATEHVMEQVALQAGVDPTQAQILGELEALLGDPAWVKAHPAAAVGLRILKANSRGGQLALTSGSGSYSPGLRGRK